MKNSERLEQCIFFISQTVEAEVKVGVAFPTRLRKALMHDFFDWAERFPTDLELRALLTGEHSSSLKDLFPMTARLVESFYV